MTAPSDAEEYDPATGTFRPIRKKPAGKPHQVYSAKAARQGAAPKPRRVTGLSESGERYGVFYEIMEGGLKSDSAKYMVMGAKIVMAVIFALLVYEAVSYRLALS
ncbi:MAG: hypothetical protein AAFU49_19255 [Pseudomonadota bacterium]